VFHEFIDWLQFRVWPMRLKAHARVSSGVNHERGLLSRRVHIVVVWELA
jgi:hypothetical protein